MIRKNECLLPKLSPLSLRRVRKKSFFSQILFRSPFFRQRATHSWLNLLAIVALAKKIENKYRNLPIPQLKGVNWFLEMINGKLLCFHLLFFCMKCLNSFFFLRKRERAQKKFPVWIGKFCKFSSRLHDNFNLIFHGKKTFTSISFVSEYSQQTRGRSRGSSSSCWENE